MLVLGSAIPRSLGNTLRETNIAPENGPSEKETIIFQPSIFTGELLVSGRVDDYKREFP